MTGEQRNLAVSVATFGGLQGQDLGRLVNLKIVNRVDEWSERTMLLGIEMSFSDERPPVRLGCCDRGSKSEVIDFAIDGPGGERINAVNAFNPIRNWCTGFQVGNAPSVRH